MAASCEMVHHLDHKQDVGGRIREDSHAAVKTPYPDAVDAPLGPSMAAAHKPTALWEWRTHALQLLMADRELINGAQLRRHVEGVSLFVC